MLVSSGRSVGRQPIKSFLTFDFRSVGPEAFTITFLSSEKLVGRSKPTPVELLGSGSKTFLIDAPVNPPGREVVKVSTRPQDVNGIVF